VKKAGVVVFAIGTLTGGAVGVLLAKQGEPVLRSVTGSIFLLWGLSWLFRLAAFGPSAAAGNRVRGALAGAGMVLLGAAQLVSDAYVSSGLAVAGLAVAIVVLIGRPRSLLRRGHNG
jgi:hypothetical protein